VTETHVINPWNLSEFPDCLNRSRLRLASQKTVLPIYHRKLKRNPRRRRRDATWPHHLVGVWIEFKSHEQIYVWAV